jgi:flavin reductase (DIM6/NTAB) family NADH-FMN oxidoreductase RutF
MPRHARLSEGATTTMPTVNERAERSVAERQFRDALAQFATGVTIITARAQNGFVGLTANSFNSVSLEPPLIIWSLARRSRSLAIFEGVERYAVNVLAHDQIELARRFSRPHTDRFAGVAFRLGEADAPLIEGCACWLECRHHALHPTGDHMLFIGEVFASAHHRLLPLIWHGGKYRVSQAHPDGRDEKQPG